LAANLLWHMPLQLEQAQLLQQVCAGALRLPIY
jgi:hypothetical protein